MLAAPLSTQPLRNPLGPSAHAPDWTECREGHRNVSRAGAQPIQNRALRCSRWNQAPKWGGVAKAVYRLCTGYALAMCSLCAPMNTREFMGAHSQHLGST